MIRKCETLPLQTWICPCVSLVRPSVASEAHALLGTASTAARRSVLSPAPRAFCK